MIQKKCILFTIIIYIILLFILRRAREFPAGSVSAMLPVSYLTGPWISSSEENYSFRVRYSITVLQ
jgi:hypothetical protein